MVNRERLIALLQGEWAALGALMRQLDDDDWRRPALPGWDVHDVVAHVVGTELMLLGRPAPEAPDDVAERPHVHNPIAAANEAWVAALAPRTPAELIEEFATVTEGRLAALRKMSDEEFDAPSWTPAGQATYGRFMRIRVFDCWMHEQDIRFATGRPGHEGGPVAEEALAEVRQALGYIVGKKARVPEAASVTITLTGPVTGTFHVVVEGRAQEVPSLPGQATASLTLPSTLFLRLAGGRVAASEVAAQIELGGDSNLARQVAENLAYTI